MTSEEGEPGHETPLCRDPGAPCAAASPDLKRVKLERDASPAPSSGRLSADYDHSVGRLVVVKEDPFAPDPSVSAGNQKHSRVWEVFTLFANNKLMCSLCGTVLSYHKNTSGMVRHLRVKHAEQYDAAPDGDGAARPAPGDPARAARKRTLDEALLDVITGDCQPFSLVEDEGFRNFVTLLDPRYALPSRKTLKSMAAGRYALHRDRVMAEVRAAQHVSLSTDMWASAREDAYLAVTGHFVSQDARLATYLLDILHFPSPPTSAHVSEALGGVLAAWDLRGKVTAVVTGDAEVVPAAARRLDLPHLPCFARALDSLVAGALRHAPELDAVRAKARAIVGLFRACPAAREKLARIQGQLGGPRLKLPKEAGARWGSTYEMLRGLLAQKEGVAAALAALRADVGPLTAPECDLAGQCLGVLEPFHTAAAELASEPRVAASKVIPLTKMLQRALEQRRRRVSHRAAAALLAELEAGVRSRGAEAERARPLAASTLLDPRFKVLAFGSSDSAQEAVRLLVGECCSRAGAPPPAPAPPAAAAAGPSLWEEFDSRVRETQRARGSAAAEAAVEMQRYVGDAYLARAADPLGYWAANSAKYPGLARLAYKYLGLPAAAVPGHQVFSKSGDVLRARRSRLRSGAVQQVLFLNHNASGGGLLR
ncbi:E3 SUMO-protein ligase ZBED1-like isoform X2 [Lepisosteus oculatus]|uniref:E3 SUMO-protein ligase ZBED1-like isoform X2 n=1 Tax=Lepisosteus oculatus TaxID=7918 RepID=UPI003720B825